MRSYTVTLNFRMPLSILLFAHDIPPIINKNRADTDLRSWPGTGVFALEFQDRHAFQTPPSICLEKLFCQAAGQDCALHWDWVKMISISAQSPFVTMYQYWGPPNHSHVFHCMGKKSVDATTLANARQSAPKRPAELICRYTLHSDRD